MKTSEASLGRSTITDLPTGMVRRCERAPGGTASIEGAGVEAASLTLGTSTGVWAAAGKGDSVKARAARAIVGDKAGREGVIGRCPR